jgi:hypothetical protein
MMNDPGSRVVQEIFPETQAKRNNCDNEGYLCEQPAEQDSPPVNFRAIHFPTPVPRAERANRKPNYDYCFGGESDFDSPAYRQLGRQRSLPDIALLTRLPKARYGHQHT